MSRGTRRPKLATIALLSCSDNSLPAACSVLRAFVSVSAGGVNYGH